MRKKTTAKRIDDSELTSTVSSVEEGDERPPLSPVAAILQSSALDSLNEETYEVLTIDDDAPDIVYKNGGAMLDDGTVVVQPVDAPATASDDGCHEVEATSSLIVGDATSSSLKRTSSFALDPLDKVKCTSCAANINAFHSEENDIQLHPVLKTLVCASCAEFYGDGCLELDVDGKENQCRWCAKGGTLMCCDRCPNSFCKTCIRRNLGRAELHHVENMNDDEEWRCYVCDKKPLHKLHTEAENTWLALKEHFEHRRKREETRRRSQAKRGLHKEGASDRNGEPAAVASVPTSKIVAAPRTCTSVHPDIMTELWYKKNIHVGDILQEIDAINVDNIEVVLKALLSALSAMSRQYNKLYGQLIHGARPVTTKSQAVLSIKSSLRMHLFLRLGKLKTLIAEEERRLNRATDGASQQHDPAQGYVHLMIGPKRSTSTRYVDLSRSQTGKRLVGAHAGRAVVAPIADGEEIVLLSDDEDDAEVLSTSASENVDSSCVGAQEDAAVSISEERRSKRKKLSPVAVQPRKTRSRETVSGNESDSSATAQKRMKVVLPLVRAKSARCGKKGRTASPVAQQSSDAELSKQPQSILLKNSTSPPKNDVSNEILAADSPPPPLGQERRRVDEDFDAGTCIDMIEVTSSAVCTDAF